VLPDFPVNIDWGLSLTYTGPAPPPQGRGGRGN